MSFEDIIIILTDCHNKHTMWTILEQHFCVVSVNMTIYDRSLLRTNLLQDWLILPGRFSAEHNVAPGFVR